MRYMLTLYDADYNPLTSGEYTSRDKAERIAKKHIKEDPETYHAYMIEELQ